MTFPFSYVGPLPVQVAGIFVIYENRMKGNKKHRYLPRMDDACLTKG